jgi:monoamine oxidase
MDTENRDVVVVGAGFAGLAAALRLAERGIDALVLEARDRVGGRVLNEPIGDGKVLEVGGQWIAPTQTRMRALTDAMGVETFKTHSAGETVVEFDGELTRFRGFYPPISKAVLADLFVAQKRLDRMARQVPVEEPWRAAKAARWDSQTFATWLRRNVPTRGGRLMLEAGTEAVWATHPADLSLLHVLFYARAAGGFEALLSTEGGAQDSRFVGGSQLVALRAAERLGDRVVLEAPVRRIEHGPAGVRVVCDDRAIQARRAIVSIPPPLAARIAYDPPLPGARDQLTQRFPMGSVVKCFAIYSEPFWRARGMSGQAISDVGPVKTAFDNSPPDGSPGILMGFLEGRQARELGRVAPDERRRAVLGCFERFFGPEAARPERYLDKAWADEEWTRGCYGASLPPNAWTDFGHALRAPIGPIHWSGTETATQWSGYMDGAVQSGERAAEEVARALGAEAREPAGAAVR